MIRRKQQDRGKYKYWRKRKLRKLREKDDKLEMSNTLPIGGKDLHKKEGDNAEVQKET